MCRIHDIDNPALMNFWPYQVISPPFFEKSHQNLKNIICQEDGVLI